MLLLGRFCGDKGYLTILRFDNDLTIEQFLLKKYIMTYDVALEHVTSHIHLCKVYNSLSFVQKRYFAEHVFKEL